jgi:hypothetical protein
VSVSKELSNYKLHLMRSQEVRWEGGDTELAREYAFLYGIGNDNDELGIVFFVNERIISAVKRAEFISRWCHIVLNIHAPTKKKLMS